MFEILNRTLIRLVPMADHRVDRLNPVVRRLARAIPAATAAFLVVATVSGPTLDASGNHDALASDSPGYSIGSELDALLAVDCLHCRPCDKNKGHEILDKTAPPGPGVEAHHPHPCQKNSGPCFLDPRDPENKPPHPQCSNQLGFDPRLDDVINDLITSTPVELAALLEHYPHRLRVNKRRKALQLLGCGNQVVGSYSVTSIPALEAFVS